jgi:hypothetical protein
MEPEIVNVCAARFGADSVCPYTRSTASSTVFATALHPQLQDTVQSPATQESVAP